MHKNQNKQIEETSVLLVSSNRLNEIERKQDEILSLLKSKTEQSAEVLNHVNEKKAIKMIGKGATWFYNKRKSGELKFKKVGSTVYYPIDELKNLLKMEDC